MRLLYLCAFVPYPVRDGDCVRADITLRALSKRHKVFGFFLDPDGRGRVPGELRKLCEGAVVVPVGRLHRALGVIRGLLRGYPMNAGGFWSWKAARLLGRSVRKWGIEGVHVHRLRMMPYADRVGKPYILDATDSLAHYFRQVRERPWGWRRVYARLDYPALRHFERRWANQSAATLAITTGEAEKISKLGVHKPVVVVPNGFDIRHWSHVGPARRGREAIFLGNLDYPVNASGLEWFLREIAPRVARLAPGTLLTVAGGGSSARFRPLIEKARMEVRFTGFLDDVRPALWRASAMLCPLPDAVGLQNKAVQALACGTPVVATSNVAKSLGAEPGVEISVADDPEIFARLVARLVRDRAMRGRLGRAGRRMAVRSFSEKCVSRSLIRAESALSRAVRRGD